MLQHTGPISGAAAHEGKYIATAGYDNRVILWERATGKPVSHASHHYLVNDCSFSRDGKHLVTSSSDCTARLWSVPNLSLKAVFADHGDDVRMSAFHPFKELIATASRDYFVRVYDFNANLIAKFNGHHADIVWLDWTHDGHQLISISDDGEIKRWPWSTRQPIKGIGLSTDEQADDALAAPNVVLDGGNDCGQVVAVKNKQATRVGAQGNRLVIDPQKSLLASVSDGTLGVWDISSANPTPIAATTLPDDVWARSCAFAGRSRLVFGTFGATHRTYDYLRDEWQTGDIAPTNGLNAVCVRGNDIITVDDSGIIRRNDAHFADVGSLCNFLVPGKYGVITGGQAGTVMDATSGQVLCSYSAPLNCCISVDIDGTEHLIVGSYSGQALVFRWDERSLVHVRNVQLHIGAITGLACNGNVVFSTCSDRTVAWHSLTNFKQLHRTASAHERVVNGCASLDDGSFASVGRDRTLRIWNRSYECITIRPPIKRSIRCVAASPRGGVISVGSYDGHVARYDATTHQLLSLNRPTTVGISSIVFSAGHGAFLCSSYDGRVYSIPEGG